MRCNIITAAVALLLMVANPTSVASFQLHRSAPVIARSITSNNALRPFATRLHSQNPNNTEEDIIGDQYEGSVDWDSEWKKVVNDRDQPAERPGKYKSQAEIAAIKATNKVAKNVFDASQDMKANIPSVPSIDSLKGDWRFWIGMIVILSFGLSLLTATSLQGPANDSFYI